MKATQAKPCPVGAETILRFLLEETLQKGFLPDAEAAEVRRLADQAAPAMPEAYFPDTYLDLSLTDREGPFLTFLLDNRERNLVNTQTEGRYFAQSGVPALLAPEQVHRVTGLAFTEGERLTLEADDALISPRAFLCCGAAVSEAEDAGAAQLIRQLRELPVRYEVYERDGVYTVCFNTGRRGPKFRFANAERADRLLSLLSGYGAEAPALSRLKGLSANYGLPYYDTGYGEWICCTDVAGFSVSFRGGRAESCRAILLLTDKGITFHEQGIKPSQAYQWHITDNCDQRCKHCYLFGEDARAKCVTTPWDMLLRTLDECTLDAARRHAWPMLAVTGGDPILHPQFWELAEEIHRRGISWTMMGNPFHLSPEVCVRLRQHGVERYQMSMDGLEPFHDYMRKPGSFRATLEALKWLNDAGIDTQLMATVSRKNMEDVLACMDIAVEYHACSFTFARYCATSPEKVEDYPSPEEYHQFLKRYYEKRRAYIEQGCKTRFGLKEHLFTLLRWELGEFTVPAFSKAKPDLVCDGCHLGRGGCILANGNVMACRRMESVVGNVWRESLCDLETCEEMERYADVKNIRKCKDCELLNWCRGCRAVGFNATGDLNAADPCCWKT